MMLPLRKALAAMPARQLNLLAAGTILIAAALVWAVALRAPLAALRQQQARLAVLKADHARTAAIRQPAADTGRLPPAPAAPAPLELVAAVSASAHAAGLAVTAATPRTERSVAGLRQRTLDLEASGSYAAILGWLEAIEQEQPAVAVISLEVRPTQDSERRQMALQLGAYSVESAR